MPCHCNKTWEITDLTGRPGETHKFTIPENLSLEDWETLYNTVFQCPYIAPQDLLRALLQLTELGAYVCRLGFVKALFRRVLGLRVPRTKNLAICAGRMCHEHGGMTFSDFTKDQRKTLQELKWLSPNRNVSSAHPSNTVGLVHMYIAQDDPNHCLFDVFDEMPEEQHRVLVDYVCRLLERGDIPQGHPLVQSLARQDPCFKLWLEQNHGTPSADDIGFVKYVPAQVSAKVAAQGPSRPESSRHSRQPHPYQTRSRTQASR
jgi:hypothetical protein